MSGESEENESATPNAQETVSDSRDTSLEEENFHEANEGIADPPGNAVLNVDSTPTVTDVDRSITSHVLMDAMENLETSVIDPPLADCDDDDGGDEICLPNEQPSISEIRSDNGEEELVEEDLKTNGNAASRIAMVERTGSGERQNSSSESTIESTVDEEDFNLNPQILFTNPQDEKSIRSESTKPDPPSILPKESQDDDDKAEEGEEDSIDFRPEEERRTPLELQREPSAGKAQNNGSFSGPPAVVREVQPPAEPHTFLPPVVRQMSREELLLPFAERSGSYVQPVPQALPTGRRKIKFRLQEEIPEKSFRKRHARSHSLFGTIKKSSTRMLRFGNASTGSMDDFAATPMGHSVMEHGVVSVSWFEGTSSLELQAHVRRTVQRKLKLEKQDAELEDMRILDESVDPPEEIVLSSYIPSGSEFLLRFSSRKADEGALSPVSQRSSVRAPLSPSAAPSPHPEKRILETLNAEQLSLLKTLKPGVLTDPETALEQPTLTPTDEDGDKGKQIDRALTETTNGEHEGKEVVETSSNTEKEEEDDMMFHSEDPIEGRLREIVNLLMVDRKQARAEGRQEKRQVVVVVLGYLFMFVMTVAFCAEIQARAPDWMRSLENHLKEVENCSASQEALFECISRGDFAGLIASVALWLSRSAATRRIFLFGFDTPKKLWTVVYESLVSSICWGISYLFIRRGMNPATRQRFLEKYWKDAMYGSLAGFNAAFLKHILKNLIPQDVVEDAFHNRQLKFLGWFPGFS